jgi:YVTN family beta-propeller protein
MQCGRRDTSRLVLLACAVCCVVALTVFVPPSVAEETTQGSSVRHRRPAALALLRSGRHVVVANERSGSLSVVDWQEGRVVAEQDIGRVLIDVIRWGDDKLLALDRAAHELIVLSAAEPEQLEILRRIRVAEHPAMIRMNPQQTQIAVTSLWSQTVIVLSTADLLDESPRPESVELPFCPRTCVWNPDGSRLFVADAFGGRLAVLDLSPLRVVTIQNVPGHNIHGLALSADGNRLVMAQQYIHDNSETSRDDIHWGTLLNNLVRSVAVEDAVDPGADLRDRSRTLFLGDVERGGADPAGLLVRADGKLIVPLAGVNEVAIDRSMGFEWKRVPVGRRPTAVALTPDEATLLVANTLDDSVSVIDVATGKEIRRITLGMTPELTAIDRGERLFYDGTRSHDAWLSCQSCHTDGHTAGILIDNSTDGGFDHTRKRTLSLRGIAETEPYAWTGAVKSLKQQLQISTESTMRGEPLTDEQAADLAAYVETLPPTPQIASARPEVAEAGRKLFLDLRCDRCHAGPEYTTPLMYDVGLIDEAGRKQFNPPSLRGVRFQGSWFHDGRAKSLDDVFRKYKHQLPRPLSNAERDRLTEFLQGL